MAEVNGAGTASPQQPAAPSQSQSQTQAQSAQTPGPTNAPTVEAPANTTVDPLPSQPATSAADVGTGTRPRDARTIHMILSAMGVQAYQERVPLQLLDFAYRYTAGILSEAQHLSSEGYTTGTSTGSGRGANQEEVGLNAVRLAASSRPSFQFTGNQLSKDVLLEMAAERNKIRLPAVDPQGQKFGLRLPHERFLLNGRGWGLNEEWDSEGDDDDVAQNNEDAIVIDKPDVNMTDDGDEREDGEPSMEDVFEEDSHMEEG